MSGDPKERLVGNIADGMQHVSRESQLCHSYRVDLSFLLDVAMGPGIELSDFPGMAREVARA